VTQRPADGIRPWPEVHGLVLDLDGTVYRGDLPLPGALEALARWRELGTPVVFVTNNSTQSRSEFAAKLNRLGCAVSEEQVVNSAHATGQVLRERYPRARPSTSSGRPH
jgi:HAD superfamily hydrolase (TIGR01450 family)